MKFSTNQRVDMCLDKRGAPQVSVLGSRGNVQFLLEIGKLKPQNKMILILKFN
jgi:hypothetical protein